MELTKRCEEHERNSRRPSKVLICWLWAAMMKKTPILMTMARQGRRKVGF
ncbi:hypothetical protein HanPSC8_Chr15g0667411 [Helianthus annuus]|nr:hypothetical protein HanPSC8_Chr15g0667411 [Helianthus annuus]